MFTINALPADTFPLEINPVVCTPLHAFEAVPKVPPPLLVTGTISPLNWAVVPVNAPVRVPPVKGSLELSDVL